MILHIVQSEDCSIAQEPDVYTTKAEADRHWLNCIELGYHVDPERYAEPTIDDAMEASYLILGDDTVRRWEIEVPVVPTAQLQLEARRN